jgi:integrase
MTVFKRGNGWAVKVWQNGCWRWVGTYPTRREARAAEQAHGPHDAWRITVEQFCERWLTDYARPAASSQRNYRYALAPFRKQFGKRKLGSIKRPEAQRWAHRVPYTPYRVVRTMYADALRDGLVPNNPFAGLRIPVPQGRRKLVPLTEEEIVALADCALEVYDEHLGPTVRALILVAGFAGLRPGELGGLEWDDVELSGTRLHVRRSIAPDGSLKAPKNGEPRVCVLAPRARDALASLERHAHEPAVFLTPRSRRFGKGAIHRYFAPVRAAFGRPKLQFYELRHACATLLLERGLAPEDVAVQLGHTDGGSLVRKLYGHPSEDRARERIAMAFTEAPEKPVASWSQPEEESAAASRDASP